MILGIDAGNYMAKTVGRYGADSYRTSMCEWFDRFVKEEASEDDMEFEIGDRKGFAGAIAEHEDEFGISSMYGNSKAHEDAKIRVLLAIYRYNKKYNLQEEYFSIVVGQPIARHSDEEKSKIKEMLLGDHECIINSETVHININDVRVATEGGAVHWIYKESGSVRYIDVGSGTVNLVSIRNGRIANNESNTLDFGVETVRTKSGIVRGIIRNASALKWRETDIVRLCGGVADEIVPMLREHFKNIKVMNPMIEQETLHSTFSNAVGLYEIAKRVYQDE